MMKVGSRDRKQETNRKRKKCTPLERIHQNLKTGTKNSQSGSQRGAERPQRSNDKLNDLIIIETG